MYAGSTPKKQESTSKRSAQLTGIDLLELGVREWLASDTSRSVNGASSDVTGRPREETAGEAIQRIDALCPWLVGAKRPNIYGDLSAMAIRRRQVYTFWCNELRKASR
jgi:hypothetical protein